MGKTKLKTAESTEEPAKLADEVREPRTEEKLNIWFQRTFSSYSKCVELNAPFAEKMSRGRHRRPHIWSPFPSPTYYGEQAMTPEQLTDACQVIRSLIAR